MVAGIELDGHPLQGRLAQGPEASRVVRAGAPPLDDRPLWEYIPTSLAPPAIPATCVRASFTGPNATKAHLKQCLVDYQAGLFSTPLFTADDDGDFVPDIVRTPRLGFVPQLHPHVPSGDLTFHNGTNRYRIAQFNPVFLQTLYLRCTGTGCQIVFDPGEPSLGLPASANQRAEALTAFALPRPSLPPEALNMEPGGHIQQALGLLR
jgi:hypothetical protein